MKALSLFSGIGGIDLAAEWSGIETVAFCEREPFCQKVLKKHWPQIPIYDDVCTLTKGGLDKDGIKAIDIIFGGYPCQPFSVAGERKGEDDHRHLWPEYFRIIKEIRPNWIVGENVAGHIDMGLDGVLSDLEDAEYEAEAFVIPACSVNAPHRRDRVFIVAHTSKRGLEKLPSGYIELEEVHYETPNSFDPFTDVKRIYGSRNLGHIRRGDGVPGKMDRLKSLGNAVVPQQIYPILAAIKQIDDMFREGKACTSL